MPLLLPFESSTKKIKQSVVSQKEERKAVFDKNKELQRVERKIEKLEKELMQINERFGDLEYGTPEFSTAQQQALEKEKELKATQKEWETLMQG